MIIQQQLCKSRTGSGTGISSVGKTFIRKGWSIEKEKNENNEIACWHTKGRNT